MDADDVSFEGYGSFIIQDNVVVASDDEFNSSDDDLLQSMTNETMIEIVASDRSDLVLWDMIAALSADNEIPTLALKPTGSRRPDILKQIKLENNAYENQTDVLDKNLNKQQEKRERNSGYSTIQKSKQNTNWGMSIFQGVNAALDCKKMGDQCGSNGKCASGCVKPATTAVTTTTTTPDPNAHHRKRRATPPQCSPECKQPQICQWECKEEKNGSNRIMFSLHIFLLALTTTLFVVH